MGNKITTIGDRVICSETEITITSEKLRGKLSKSYERAREDVQKRKWYNYFSIGFSVAGTLLIALLTAAFKPLGNLSEKGLTIIAWIVFGISLLYSVVAVCFRAKSNSADEHNERDLAINAILDEIKKGE